MINLNCPACGAEVKFLSKSCIFAVCSYCKSSLVRQDMDLEKIGTMADLQDDLAPLQIGTTGMYEGKCFEVIGRLRIAYDDGYWNEWYALFPDGSEAWLPEAQGFYGMCFPSSPQHIPPSQQLKPGYRLKIGVDPFEVEDVQKVHCIYAEGQLPFEAAQGRAGTSVDLVGYEGNMATIEFAGQDARVYVGKYIDFDDFKFQNLRKIDGW